MTTPTIPTRRTGRARLFIGLALAALTALAGCDADEEPTQLEDTLEVSVDTAPDTSEDLGGETQVDVPTVTVVATDPNWSAPAMPEACSVCQSCFGDGDCDEGESCIAIDGRSVCTALCSTGACPGDSRCFEVSENGGRATAVCLNPNADTSLCDASWYCGGTPPDLDMDMVDGDMGSQYPPPNLGPDGYAVQCNIGSVCNYCGGPTDHVTACPETNQSEHCKVFRLVNQERGKVGLPALVYNAELAVSAQMHAIDMSVCHYHEHDSLDGRDFADRELAAGYTGSPGGENIATGQRTAEEVMEAWMNSQGHRENILRDSFTEIGVGFYEGNPDGDQWSGRRWVQNFGVR